MAREIAFIPDPGAPPALAATVAGPKGETGEGWVPDSVPTFIQATEPVHTGRYFWIDTSSGRNIWKFEDGEP